MKSIGAAFIICILAQTAFSQRANNTLSLAVSGDERISVVKSSVRLAEWHERAFWPLYETYLEDATRIYSSTYRSLKDLTETDRSVATEDAFNNGWNLLTYRNEELELRKKYYREIGAVLNGVVALQFLQTEAMMDMLESSQIYSKSPWRDFRFHGQSLPGDQVRDAKHNMLASALEIPAEKVGAFWNVYRRYEHECDALLGEGYSVYSLFASNAADFTPALAKRLGYDLLQVMEREIKLKEKYFLEMNAAVGSTLAARFLAWEDYYSIVSKMYTWADTR